MRADDAEDIDRDPVPPQDLVPAHRLLEGGSSVPPEAVPVVDLPRTVQAEADRESLGGQEPPPPIVEQRAVGLHSVGDRPAVGTEATLDIDDFTEIIDAQDGGFPAVPGEPDDLVGRGGEVLGDVVLEEVEGHRSAGCRHDDGPRPTGAAGPEAGCRRVLGCTSG